jgi:hypothetical protein
MLRYLTAGESHGQALVVIIEGLPAGLEITVEEIQVEMARRRLGYGRGPRQRFEADELTLVGGVRHGRTLGSPVAIEIKNSEWSPSWGMALHYTQVTHDAAALKRDVIRSAGEFLERANVARGADGPGRRSGRDHREMPSSMASRMHLGHLCRAPLTLASRPLARRLRCARRTRMSSG